MQQCPIVGKPKPQSICQSGNLGFYTVRRSEHLRFTVSQYAIRLSRSRAEHVHTKRQYQTRCDAVADTRRPYSQTELLVLVLSVILTSHSRTSRHGSYAPQGQAKHETWPHRYGTQALDVFSTLKVLPIVAGPKVGRDGWRQPIGGHRRCLCAHDERRSRAGSSHRRLC